ncbi:peptidoglycan hydrolase [Burkholderia territorii]|uniref:peptidoglycan hydrolase n=1 Tax=Burkholderia territorii TaxID=1503055 RepID=UPI000AB61618|nr:peptidoglycan hydrolase [Burkholderia territorii]
MSTAIIETRAAGPGGLTTGTTAPAPAANAERGKAAHAAEQFEALFVSHMLRQMRNSIREISPEGSMFRDQIGSGLMEFMDTAVSQALASQRAFGIADFILRQIAPGEAGARAARRDESASAGRSPGAATGADLAGV